MKKERKQQVAISLEDARPLEEKKEKHPIVELQLSMATNSINHEYARLEYDEVIDYQRREELLHYMDECRRNYQEARDKLSIMSPLTLEKFEADLAFQKKTTLQEYHA